MSETYDTIMKIGDSLEDAKKKKNEKKSKKK